MEEGISSPLFKRFVVPILFVVTLGVGLTTGISYFYTKRSVEALAMGQMSQTLMFLNKDLTGKVKGVESDCILWSQEEVFRLALGGGYLARSARGASDKRLAERVYYNGYDRAFLAKPDGNVVSSSVEGMAGSLNIADREYFKRSLAGKIGLETLEAGRYSGRSVLVMSCPVYGQDKDVSGVMVVAVDIARVAKDTLEEVRIGNTGGAYFLDKYDKMLASPSWKGEGQFGPSPEVARQLRMARNAKVVRYMGGRIERMAVAVTNPETGWLLVVEADSAEILKPAAKLAALNGFIAVAVLGLVIVVLWLLRNAIADLRESEARYRTVTETTPVGIATFDSQGRPVYMNHRALDILGISPGEPEEGKSWLDRFESREGQPVPPGELPMAKTLAGPVPARTVWYRGPLGGRTILSLSAVPLETGQGPASGAVAVIEDITERTRIQEMMVQTEKMLSVGGLAAGMAHEINNPLASILQAVQVINRRLDPDLPANITAAQALGIDFAGMRAYMHARGLDEFLDSIKEAGVRAARIVTNMLGFARKSGGVYGECDLAELLDRTAELAGGDYDLSKQYDFKKIEIVREFQEGLSKVECQPMEIEQVFFNIIKNAAQAFKAVSGTGRAPRITLRTRSEGSMAVAEIEDNGPGMAEEIRKRVFEPFYTTKDIGEGTGLGLSVAYFIVSENHKGAISVESSPGMGTRFIVKLPLKRLQ